MYTCILKVVCNLLLVFLITVIVSDETKGGKSLNEEVILSVVGSVALLPLSKPNKLHESY